MRLEIQDIFSRCIVNGCSVILPEQLDRKDYQEVAKILKNNQGKWVGGKTQAIVFPYEPIDIVNRLAQGEEVNTKKAFQFFPTPKEVVDFVIQLGMPMGAMRILEPSAGQGHIVEGINDFCGWHEHTIDCVELNPVNRSVLKSKGMNLVGADFMEFEPKELYDMVIANPPFNTNGSSQGYVDHLVKMNECVKEGGTVISVVPSSFRESTNKRVVQFKELLKKHDVDWQIYDLSDRAFSSSGTNVSTCVINFEAFSTKEPEVLNQLKMEL